MDEADTTTGKEASTEHVDTEHVDTGSATAPDSSVMADIIRAISSEESEMTEEYTNGVLQGLMHGNNGVDPGLLALMKDGEGLGSNGWLVLLFLLILGRGGPGFGGYGGCGPNPATDATVVNEANYSRLLDAISTQGTRQEVAVQGLAQAFNTTAGDVMSALAGVDKQIAVSGGSIATAISNMQGMVMNGISHSESGIKSAIQSCCCNIGNKVDNASATSQLAIERMGNAVTQDIQQTRYQIAAVDAAQTANLTNKFCQHGYEVQRLFADQNAYLAQQFAEIKTREDARQISELQQRLADAKATANTTAILSAIQNKDTVNLSGTLNSTAGTWEGAGSLS